MLNGAVLVDLQNKGLSFLFLHKMGFVVKHLTACELRLFGGSNILLLFYVKHIFPVNNKIIKAKHI